MKERCLPCPNKPIIMRTVNIMCSMFYVKERTVKAFKMKSAVNAYWFF